ncbi:hypothetical protein H4R19_004019 [Coemansia spiralis]|nr:hypothetical protein H4R19_004019 [Coemansia spiralis]
MDTIILAASALLAATHARAAWRPAHILGRAATRAVWHHRHGPLPIPIPSPAAGSQTAQAQSGLLACGVLILVALTVWVYKACNIVRARNNAVAERLAAESALEDVAAEWTVAENAVKDLADQRLAAEADRQNTAAMKAAIEATRDAAAIARVGAEAGCRDAAGQLAAAEAARNEADAKQTAAVAAGVEIADRLTEDKAQAIVRNMARWDATTEAATDEAADLRAAAEDAAAKLANATERAETLSNRVDELEQRWNDAQAALEADIRTALEPTQDENATPAQCAAAEREAGQIKYRLRWMQLVADLAEANHVFEITDEKARELSGKVTDQCVEQTKAEFALEAKIYDFEDKMKREKGWAREYLNLAVQLNCRCPNKRTDERMHLLCQIWDLFK